MAATYTTGLDPVTDFLALADLVTAKRALRARIRAERRTRTSLQRRLDGEALASVLMELPQIHAARCVAAYASTPTEPGTDAVRAALGAIGVRVLLPIVLPDGVLDWAEDEGDLVAVAGLGGPEPTGPRLGPGAITQADALVVPALAVDTLGYRLGQGAGYYDRVLASLDPHVPVIALVYEGEVLDAAVEPVPAEPHDVPVDAVVTPLGCLHLDLRA